MGLVMALLYVDITLFVLLTIIVMIMLAGEQRLLLPLLQEL